MRSGLTGKIVLVAILASLVLVAAAIALNFLLNKQESPYLPPTLNPTPTPTNSIHTQTPNPTASVTQVTASPINVIGAEVFGGDLVDGTINWGTLQIWESRNVSFYLKSTSDVPIRLAFSTTDWNPPGMESYIRLSWNYGSYPLNPGQTIFLTLTLNTQFTLDGVSFLVTNNERTFNFNFNIYPSN